MAWRVCGRNINWTSAVKITERVDLITRDYIRRLENDISIPSWLEKQKEAILLDNRNGLYLLEEGLIEEREWITSLLMNAA